MFGKEVGKIPTSFQKKSSQKRGNSSGLSYKSVRLSLHCAASQASRAYVLFGNCTLLVDDGNFLDIRIPMSRGFTITVADGISAHFSFTANAANSRHISITSVTNLFSVRKRRAAEIAT